MLGAVSKRSWIVLAAIGVWTLVIVFGWATRPIDDTTPVVIDPASQLAADLAADPTMVIPDRPVARTVECNSLLDGTARALPDLPDGFVFERPPCDGPRGDARLAFGVNLIAIAAMLVAWYWFAVRLPSRPARSSADAEFVH